MEIVLSGRNGLNSWLESLSVESQISHFQPFKVGQSLPLGAHMVTNCHL